ncbi:TPA: restriction endonuclease subunit S [Photobacterium damselae]
MVPNGWQKVNLKCLLSTTIKNGYSPNAVEQETGYVVLGLGALTDNKLDASSIKNVEATEQVLKSQLSQGDFLISRSNTPDKVGRSCMFRGEVANCSYPDLMMKFRANEVVIEPVFLEVYLQSSRTRQYFQNCAAGSSSSMVKITKSVVEKAPVLLPPLPEQHKIAQILSTWDRAITTTEKLIETSKQQKKALMQQLLTGKKRLIDPETGKVFEGEWEEVKLGEICDVKGGKRLPKGESLQEHPNAFPYIRVADMHMGGVDLSNLLYVPVQIAPSIKNYTITSKDLFITVAGTLGLVGKIPKELDGANLTENADKLTNITCNQVFLMYVLMSPIIQKHIDAESTQNAQPKLALTRIRGFSFNLPANNEQKRIASVLTAADKDIELLEAKLAYLKQEKKALMQQLLTGKRRVSLSS